MITHFSIKSLIYSMSNNKSSSNNICAHFNECILQFSWIAIIDQAPV